MHLRLSVRRKRIMIFTALASLVCVWTIIILTSGTNRVFGVSLLGMSENYVGSQSTYGMKSPDTYQKPAASIEHKHPLVAFRYMTASGGDGRLGNHMFIVASLLGVSSLHGYRPVIRSFPKLDAVFNITRLKYVDTERTKYFIERTCCTYDTRVETLSHDYNWTLSGYMQSWKYFESVAPDVRSLFRFRDDILRQAVDFISRINVTGSVIVGVHVRRFDAASNDQWKLGRVSPGRRYIEAAADYFRNLYSSAHFVIVSDDTAWCRENINITGLTISNFSDAGVDMAILSLCDHVVVTSGTFGWWGAWLARGRAIYFSGFPRSGSWLETQFNKEDYYPLNWIGITQGSTTVVDS